MWTTKRRRSSSSPRTMARDSYMYSIAIEEAPARRRRCGSGTLESATKDARARRQVRRCGRAAGRAHRHSRRHSRRERVATFESSMHLATDNTATEEAGRSSLSVSRSSVSMGLQRQRLRQCPRRALRVVLPTPERVEWGKGTAPVLSCRIPFLLASNQLHAPVCKLLNIGAPSKSVTRCSYM
jgi:hypothetical protein